MAAETIRMSQLLSPNAGDPKIEVSSASDDQGQPEKAGTGASEPSMIRTNKHGSYCLIDDPLPPSKDSDPRNEELPKGEAGVTAGSIQPTLEKQLAVLSGGMDSTRPILVLPAVGLKKLDSGAASMEEMIKTLLYFKHLLSGGIQSFGITIVMDARSTKTHTPTKTILEDMAAGKFPFVAQKLIVLQKASLMGFGRPKVLATPEVTKKLKVVFVGEKDSIEQYVDASQLTSDLGGTLCYDHITWVSNRVEFERLAEMYSTAMEKVPQLAAAMNQFDVPESVEEAERLMQDSLQKKEKLVQLISQVELSMDVMLSQLQQPRPEVMGMAMTKDYNSMLSSISHMLDTLKREEERHDRFWAVHKCRIDHMMQLCHFNRTVEKEKGLMSAHLSDLNSSEQVVGETLESALELGEKHEVFVQECMKTLDKHMNQIREDAQAICDPKFASQEDDQQHSTTSKAIEAVKEGMHELTEMYQRLMSACQQKRELFIVSVQFHMNMRQCQQWSQDVLKYLAALPLEDLSSPSSASSIIAELERFLDLYPHSKLSLLREICSSLPTKPFSKLLQTTVQCYETSYELLMNRKSGLSKVVTASFQSSPRSATQKKNKAISEPLQVVDVSQSLQPELLRSRVTEAKGASEDFVDYEEDPAELKARKYVYEELLSTERDYIKDLEHVVNTYYDEMDPNATLPPRLRGKRDTVFGNIKEIYSFHNEVFLKELEKYEHTPERVGECFVKHDAEFGMYFDYCKNKTNSENLMNESTESQAFFKNLQLRMGDGLPLHTYLIKPVQRVTKYQLLLKDMIKHSKNAPAALEQLQSALDRMLKVLKSLNDSLHVVGLKGYPGSLAEQGRLLLHDPFTLRESSGKIARGKQQRHMFLFEKVIIFTKKREVPSQKVREKKTDCYFYKEHIQMAGIGLRPLLDHHPLQFDITVHGQNRVIKFQSASKEARDLWVSEIRRLLELQFTLIKEIAVNSGTLDRRVYKGGKASLKPMSSKFALADSLRRDSAPPVQIIKKTRTDRFRLNWKKKESKPPPPKASQTLSVTHSLPIVGMRRRDGGHLTDIREDVVKTPESGESVSSDEDIPFSEEEEEEEEETTGGALEFHYDSLAPGAPRHYKAIANFNQLEQENSVSLTVDQEVEVIGINQYGWWWVRATNNVTGETEEGWAPASYLQVMQKPLPLQT